MNNVPVSNIGKPIPATAGITSGRMGSSTANTYEYVSNMGGYPIESRLNSSGPHTGKPMDDLTMNARGEEGSSGLGLMNPMHSQYSRGNGRAIVGNSFDKTFASTMNAAGKTGAFGGSMKAGMAGPNMMTKSPQVSNGTPL